MRGFGSRDSGWERVNRDPIGSFHKHGHVVDFEVERAAGHTACSSLFFNQFNSSNAEFVLTSRVRTRSHDFDSQQVQMRFAMSIRPPQDRILDRRPNQKTLFNSQTHRHAAHMYVPKLQCVIAQLNRRRPRHMQLIINEQV